MPREQQLGDLTMIPGAAASTSSGAAGRRSRAATAATKAAPLASGTMSGCRPEWRPSGEMEKTFHPLAASSVSIHPRPGAKADSTQSPGRGASSRKAGYASTMTASYAGGNGNVVHGMCA